MTGSPLPEDGQPLVELTAVMARLRAECAWKAGQAHRSLAGTCSRRRTRHSRRSTPVRGALREEPGDLLLQVGFHAVMAGRGRAPFTIDDVGPTNLIAKLVRRNPHVFGDADATSGTPSSRHHQRGLGGDGGALGVKRRVSVLDGPSPTLPALLLAEGVNRLTRSLPPPGVREIARRGVRLLAIPPTTSVS